MRCEIAASLLHSPKILFLDEPTIGLDAVSKIAVRQFIRKLNVERGTTVILTTHDMQDIEALTERILLIGKGRILFDGSLDELKKRSSRRKTLVVEYTGDAPEIPESMNLVEIKDGRLIVTLDPEVSPVSDAIAHFAASAELTDVSVSGITAEEMVAERKRNIIYEKVLRGVSYMKKYLALFRIRFVYGLQYRAAALAGVVTQFAWGALRKY
jgi:ABC-2 type transport system ATP-binding protein